MENENGLDNTACGYRCNILFLGCKQYFIPNCNKFIHVCVCTLEAFYLLFVVPYQMIWVYKKDRSRSEFLLWGILALLAHVLDILFFIPGLPSLIWWLGVVTIIIQAVFIIAWIFCYAGPGGSRTEQMYACKYKENTYFSMDQVKEEYRIKPYDEGLRPKWGFLFPVEDAPMEIEQKDK